MFTRFIPKNRIDSCPFFWVLLIIMALISGSPAQADTFTVTNLSDSGLGSLRQAIIDAEAIGGDNTIEFQSGLSGTITLTGGELAISSNITINGPGANKLIVSGSFESRIFNITKGATVTIGELKLTDGLPSGPGGAIFKDTGTLTLRNCVLTGNRTGGSGGALHNEGGNVTIFNSTVSNNLAVTGGGLSHQVSRNSEVMTIINSTVADNKVNGYWGGGGIYKIKGTLTIVNSTVSGNKALLGGQDGGGIENSGGILTITNSTVSGNIADARGGGISSDSTVVPTQITNSTVSGNHAGQNGGGIYHISGVGGSMNLGNTLVAGNTAYNSQKDEIYNYYPDGSVISQGNNLFGVRGVSGLYNVTPAVTDIIPPAGVTLNQIIGSLAPNGGPTKTHSPVAGSLAINHGNNALIPAGVITDQRGYGPRSVGAAVDIGSVEVGAMSYYLTVTKTGGNGLVTSTPAGIDCGDSCTARFDFGTRLTLTAQPDTGYSFSGWAGDCTGTAPTCTVTMTSPTNVTALFANIPAFTLTVTKAGNGTGTVASTPAGINCGSDCSESYPTNTLVKLTATPAAGSVFVNWSGACAGTATTCTVKIDAAKTATATFKRVATLTVAKAGSGAGRISGPNINCGLDCAETYDLNTVVTLTAAPYAGSTHIGWFNCPANPTPNQCRVTMSASRTVTARFNTTTVGKTALTLYKAGVGLGTVTSTPAGITCGPTCPASVVNFTTGATVVLTAVETTGSSFTGWTGCTVNPANRRQCTVVLNTGKVVSATFTRPVLTVRKVGSGLVVNRPDGIFCGTDCTEPYNLNTVATLIAIPATGYRFNGWSGCTADPGFPQMCIVRMNQSTTATASFIR